MMSLLFSELLTLLNGFYSDYNLSVQPALLSLVGWFDVPLDT